MYLIDNCIIMFFSYSIKKNFDATACAAIG